ncbi:pyrroline-5-carboxylate reductase [Halomonas halocynthiae]|uniref:pyrroline-5-carboxylate reductase n=1 Tax=Halomonas halocynthiae TaxID=176290 RepID=UPI0003FEE6F0|nr:pyrroline-5-carboxylate reductase [Halomonas halocynthiae]
MASHITFIGAGNMASAIIEGLINSGHDASSLTATATSDTTLSPLRSRLGIKTSTDNIHAIADCDVVVLSVKPQIMHQVCEQIRDSIQARKPLVISVAAGLTADTLERWLGGNLAVVRCMPNTPSLVGVGASGLYANANVSSRQRQLAEDLLNAVGIVEWVDDEQLLEVVTAVSGSAPAYFFLMFEAMEEAAVARGLPAATARRLALQTALGAATMAMDSDQSPSELKRNVMSPGGTTERAIQRLESGGLRQLLQDAMGDCANKASEMAKQFSTR